MREGSSGADQCPLDHDVQGHWGLTCRQLFLWARGVKMDRQWVGERMRVGVLVEELVGVSSRRGGWDVCGERWGLWRRGQWEPSWDVCPVLKREYSRQRGDGKDGVLSVALRDRRGSLGGHRWRWLGWSLVDTSYNLREFSWRRQRIIGHDQ